MKSNVKQSNREAAFTIVELLTVMSIIVILIGLLVPALNKVKQYAYEVKQKAQFHSIDAAIELFNSEFDGYPNSNEYDGMPGSTTLYCGAMKLCEAMMGRDLKGFHPNSIFRADGMDNTGSFQLYPAKNSVSDVLYRNSLNIRKGPYLPLENANAFRIEDLYEDTGNFSPEHFVLCDVFRRVTHKGTGRKVGMPILYYKANTANIEHDVDAPDDPLNIYDYKDNLMLVALGFPSEEPGSGGRAHSLLDPRRFYLNTENDKVPERPFRSDTYILISAGYDGEYGTPDDICNFDWSYRELP